MIELGQIKHPSPTQIRRTLKTRKNSLWLNLIVDKRGFCVFAWLIKIEYLNCATGTQIKSLSWVQARRSWFYICPWPTSSTALLAFLWLWPLSTTAVSLSNFLKYEIENSCRASASLCSYSALVRNLIAYADFLTLATIALTTCVGFVLPEFFRRVAGPLIAIIACVLIWLLSLAIISPMVFGFDLFGRSFGKFGWANLWGRCQVFHPEGTESRGNYVYNYGVTIPFIVIFIRCNSV